MGKNGKKRMKLPKVSSQQTTENTTPKTPDTEIPSLADLLWLSAPPEDELQYTLMPTSMPLVSESQQPAPEIERTPFRDRLMKGLEKVLLSPAARKVRDEEIRCRSEVLRAAEEKERIRRKQETSEKQERERTVVHDAWQMALNMGQKPGSAFIDLLGDPTFAHQYVYGHIEEPKPGLSHEELLKIPSIANACKEALQTKQEHWLPMPMRDLFVMKGLLHLLPKYEVLQVPEATAIDAVIEEGSEDSSPKPGFTVSQLVKNSSKALGLPNPLKKRTTPRAAKAAKLAAQESQEPQPEVLPQPPTLSHEITPSADELQKPTPQTSKTPSPRKHHSKNARMQQQPTPIRVDATIHPKKLDPLSPSADHLTLRHRLGLERAPPPVAIARATSENMTAVRGTVAKEPPTTPSRKPGYQSATAASKARSIPRKQPQGTLKKPFAPSPKKQNTSPQKQNLGSPKKLPPTQWQLSSTRKRAQSPVRRSDDPFLRLLDRQRLEAQRRKTGPIRAHGKPPKLKDSGSGHKGPRISNTSRHDPYTRITRPTETRKSKLKHTWSTRIPGLHNEEDDAIKSPPVTFRPDIDSKRAFSWASTGTGEINVGEDARGLVANGNLKYGCSDTLGVVETPKREEQMMFGRFPGGSTIRKVRDSGIGAGMRKVVERVSPKKTPSRFSDMSGSGVQTPKRMVSDIKSPVKGWKSAKRNAKQIKEEEDGIGKEGAEKAGMEENSPMKDTWTAMKTALRLRPAKTPTR